MMTTIHSGIQPNANKQTAVESDSEHEYFLDEKDVADETPGTHCREKYVFRYIETFQKMSEENEVFCNSTWSSLVELVPYLKRMRENEENYCEHETSVEDKSRVEIKDDGDSDV